MSNGAKRERSSGILLHISSLPSEFGIGDLGPNAYRWIDFLARSRQRYWQLLPLNPTSAKGHNSPYQSTSAFAGNPLFVSPFLLRESGLLTDADLSANSSPSLSAVDYTRTAATKLDLLRTAFVRFRSHDAPSSEFDAFCQEHASWLDDYCLFAALRAHYPDRPWHEWAVALRNRDAATLERAREEHSERIAFERFTQFQFYQQWFRLKQYANQSGVQLLGDVPYYVGLDCADVWAHPNLFKLDAARRPSFLAGVPPDRFSDTGQLWDNPVYDWPTHERTRYDWWVSRLEHNLDTFDAVRIDHFRGFAAYWEVPAESSVALNGRWMRGPGGAVIDALKARRPEPALVAEDLGVITEDVRELIDRYSLPSMKVLLFAFDEDDSEHATHNHIQNAVVYTGTHDNNTVRGWLDEEASAGEKERLERYLGRDLLHSRIHWEVIRLAMMSVARIAIIPMQDLLGLGSDARMNQPATADGNWQWRMSRDHADDTLAERLLRLSVTYGRSSRDEQ